MKPKNCDQYFVKSLLLAQHIKFKFIYFSRVGNKIFLNKKGWPTSLSVVDLVCVSNTHSTGCPEKNVRLQEGNSACKRTFFWGHLVDWQLLYIRIQYKSTLNWEATLVYVNLGAVCRKIILPFWNRYYNCNVLNERYCS